MSATTAVTYSERLHPSPGWTIGALLLSAMTSLLLIPLTVFGGVALAVVVMIAVLIGLTRASARVVVTPETFVAGPAAIERRFITGARGFDVRASFVQRGQELDARAYLMLRPWVKTVVRVDIDDPEDPTPYWLVSTRHPQALAAALSS